MEILCKQSTQYGKEEQIVDEYSTNCDAPMQFSSGRIIHTIRKRIYKLTFPHNVQAR